LRECVVSKKEKVIRPDYRGSNFCNPEFRRVPGAKNRAAAFA
jgi:hypothetical protein